MSEAVFYIKQQKGKLGIKLQSLIHTYENCDCIYPVEDYRDLYSLSSQDMNEFLNVLAHETDYETIIFNIGYMSESSLVLMESCDKIILPKAENSIQEKMQESFERFLTREGLKNTISNIDYITM